MSDGPDLKGAAFTAVSLGTKLVSLKVVAIAAAILCVIGLLVGIVFGIGALSAMQDTKTGEAAACLPGGAAVGADVEGVDGGFLDYDQDAMERAAIILNTAEGLGVGRQGQLVALITAMQESTLGANTQPTGSGNDAGPFQQRTLPGWYGTLDQVNDPAYATTAFIEGVDIDYAGPGSAGPEGYHIPGLKDLAGWESMSPGVAAQRVQISAHPDRYADHVDNANQIIDHLAGATVNEASVSDTGGGATEAAAPDKCGGGEYEGAETMDQLPQFPVPDGCTDQTPVFAEYGPNGLNGNVPDSALCKYPAALDSDGRGQARAVAAYLAMNEDFKATFGHDLVISSTYRTYDDQIATKASRGVMAATPGWSNHGFGLAIDIRGTQLEKRWIQQNGPEYGWWHPTWARPDGRKPEDWHYEYGTWLVAPEYQGMDPSRVAY